MFYTPHHLYGKGVRGVEEEIALLEEQLANAHADIERLQEQAAEATARAGRHESDLAAARRELDDARLALGERDDAIAGHLRRIESLETAAREAGTRSAADAARYRELLLAHESSLPADLVAGDSIEAVDAAAEQARRTVAQVRQHLEDQARAQRVPAGSPPRAEPDLNALSPAEKIRAGLEQR
jgi:chromosome segregation ATPase